MAKLTVAQKRARLFEFADFLDNLKEEKFNIRKWCSPDHTCKTVACIAGWAGINYSKKAKLFIAESYEKQILNKEIRNFCNLDNPTEEEEKGISAVRKRLWKLMPIEPDWSTIGRVELGLDIETARNLFYSSRDFWYHVRGNITNKMAARAIRYVACHPKHRLLSPKLETSDDDNFYYDEAVMDAFIAENIGKYKLAA